MNTVQILQEARELIHKAWCRRRYAVDAKYKSVKPTDPKACRFCAIGAVSRAAGQAEPVAAAEYWRYLDKAAVEKGAVCTVHFNDSKKNKRDVIRLFDRAIELAAREKM